MRNVSRLSVVFLLALTLVPSAFAAKKKPLHDEVSGQGYGTAGCGLGSIVFGTKPGMIQILAATTNGTAGTQTFGISSGTSNCDGSGEAETASLNFIEANKVSLANDMAKGGGETLVGLFHIYGCQDSEKGGQVLQKNFDKVFPGQNVEAEEIDDQIKILLIENNLCGDLS